MGAGGALGQAGEAGGSLGLVFVSSVGPRPLLQPEVLTVSAGNQSGAEVRAMV